MWVSEDLLKECNSLTRRVEKEINAKSSQIELTQRGTNRSTSLMGATSRVGVNYFDQLQLLLQLSVVSYKYNYNRLRKINYNYSYFQSITITGSITRRESLLKLN